MTKIPVRNRIHASLMSPGQWWRMESPGPDCSEEDSRRARSAMDSTNDMRVGRRMTRTKATRRFGYLPSLGSADPRALAERQIFPSWGF